MTDTKTFAIGLEIVAMLLFLWLLSSAIALATTALASFCFLIISVNRNQQVLLIFITSCCLLVAAIWGLTLC
jgi:hypothetical protein